MKEDTSRTEITEAEEISKIKEAEDVKNVEEVKDVKDAKDAKDAKESIEVPGDSAEHGHAEELRTVYVSTASDAHAASKAYASARTEAEAATHADAGAKAVIEASADTGADAFVEIGRDAGVGTNAVTDTGSDAAAAGALSEESVAGAASGTLQEETVSVTAGRALTEEPDGGLSEGRSLRDEIAEIADSRPTAEERAARAAEQKAAEKAAKKAARKRRRNRGGGVFPKRIPYALLMIIMGLAGAALMCALIIVDAFPAELTYIVIGIMFAMLIITSILLARRRPWKRFIGVLLAFLFIALFGSVTYYLGETYAMMNRITENNTYTKAETGSGASVDPTTQSFNLYITGIDRWAGELDLDRSDVNMIMTIHPITKKILLTSIPRDTYVKLHTAQQMDKLTHTGIYGVDETINTVQDWLGIDISYYLKLNFSSMRGIINAIGGIDVYSPVAFDSDISDCSFVKGWNHLNGREALYFARERHAFEGQDSMRVENQQRVVKAVIKKLTSSTALLTNYTKIMDVAGSNLNTNMSTDEIQSLVKMQMSDLASWDVETQKIEGEYGMGYVASLSSKNQYSIYNADQESIDKCLKAIDEVLNPPQSEVDEAIENSKKGFVTNLIERLKEYAEKVKEKASEAAGSEDADAEAEASDEAGEEAAESGSDAADGTDTEASDAEAA